MKKQVKFYARLPLLAPQRTGITKCAWEKLPAESRDVYEVECLSADKKWYRRRGYLKVCIIPNPAIQKLERLLKKQRLVFTKILTDKEAIFSVGHYDR